MKKILVLVSLLAAGLHIEAVSSSLVDWHKVDMSDSGDGTVVTMPTGQTALKVTFRMGALKRGSIEQVLRGGEVKRIPLRIQDDVFQPPKPRKAKETPPAISMKNAILWYGTRNRGGVMVHALPYLRRYTPKQIEERMEQWLRLADATASLYTLELRQVGAEYESYMDGHYIGSSEGVIDKIIFKLPREGGVVDAWAGTAFYNERFLPLETKWMARPGSLSEGRVSIGTGRRVLLDMPFVVATGKDSADVGVVREMRGSHQLEVDEHLQRTPLDGMRESIHTTVPADYYSRAWVLCAVDPNPELDPIVTVRMTRYGRSGRGDGIALETFKLPQRDDAGLPERVTLVGNLELAGDKLPLYLLEMDLKPGIILDLLNMQTDSNAIMMSQTYLDIDFMGKPDKMGAQWDRTRKPDNSSSSGVHIFGVTLEKMPFEMIMEQSEYGNVFHNGQKPVTKVRIKSKIDGSVGVLRWSIIDSEGGEVRQERREVNPGAAGMEQVVELSLDCDQPGWYGLKLELLERGGRIWLSHDAAFALLGEDTRQAGFESPFGTGWFNRFHYSGGEPEIGGSLFLKAGLRKISLRDDTLTEENMAEYKITRNAIPWGTCPKSIEDKAEAEAELKQKVDALLKRFPHCDVATIFHESFANNLPSVLFGIEPDESPEDIEKIKGMVELGNFLGEFYRRNYPGIKLIVGNTTHSTAIIDALLRHGLKPEYIDWIGIETVGQTFIPEKLTGGGVQGSWLALETAKRLGYDLPVNGCTEFQYRTERTLGEPLQAAFYVRDTLISLAYGYERVTPAMIMDVGNSYYNSLWGATGLCRRYPFVYPKQSYVAIATLTKVLDRARFVEMLDTGSRSVHALEFKRSDGKYVTALWNLVGEAAMELSFGGAAAIEQVEMLGVSRNLRADTLTVNASAAPRYLLSDRKVESAKVVKRSYEPPPPGFKVVEGMGSAEHWQVSEGSPRIASKRPSLPYYKPGKFTVESVNDDEKGSCLEVALVKEGEMETLVSEYTFLRLEDPLAIGGKPSDIGIWIKGDSGWGKIIFEIEDDTGRQYRTEGSYHDWPGDLAINFDGWRFIRYGIDGVSREPNISPTPRWGDRRPIVFPIKLRGVYVALNRQALEITEMREAPARIRMKDIGFVYE